MDKPLAGKRIVVTRSREQAAETITQLRNLGAAVIPFPTIQFQVLDEGIARLNAVDLSEYDWLLVTSQNAVQHSVGAKYISPSQWPRMAVSGEKTAAAVRAHGVEPALIPHTFVGEALVEALGNVQGQRILFPRAKKGRPEVVALLHERGAVVDEVHLYDTVRGEPDEAAFAELERGADVVIFTSPTTVRYFCEMADVEVIKGMRVACIGDVTAGAAVELGLHVDIVPDVFTMDGVLEAIVRYFGNGRDG